MLSCLNNVTRCYKCEFENPMWEGTPPLATFCVAPPPCSPERNPRWGPLGLGCSEPHHYLCSWGTLEPTKGNPATEEVVDLALQLLVAGADYHPLLLPQRTKNTPNYGADFIIKPQGLVILSRCSCFYSWLGC